MATTSLSFDFAIASFLAFCLAMWALPTMWHCLVRCSWLCHTGGILIDIGHAKGFAQSHTSLHFPLVCASGSA